MTTQNSPTPAPPPPDSPPLWVAIAGAAFGGLTLIFLMLVVILSVFVVEVPDGTRFTLVAAIALGAALSFGFLGGTAAVSGNLPLPFGKDWASQNPIKFSVTGGSALLIIVLLLGYWLYVKIPSPIPGPRVNITRVNPVRDGDHVNLSLLFEAQNIVDGMRVYAEIAKDDKFKDYLVPRQPLDNPGAGSALLGIPAPPGKEGWVRLIVISGQDKIAAASQGQKFTVP